MANKQRKFVRPNRDQLLLLPPDVKEWVEEGHLSRWMIRAVETLDLKPFYDFYGVAGETTAGRPPYDPAMMLTMVFYALASRQMSSRKMEAMSYNDLGARFIMANQHPDHSVFAKFRDNHKGHMEWAFSQVLYLCHEAGLIDLSFVAIDSTVIKANASLAKTIRVDKLNESLAKAMTEANRLLEELDCKNAQEAAELTRKLRSEGSRLLDFQKALSYLESRGVELPGQASDAETHNSEERENRSAAVGAMLKKIRLQKRLSLHLLEEMTKISKSALSRYENGQRCLSESQKMSIASALGIDAADLPTLLAKARIVATVPRINPSDLESYMIKRKESYYQGYLSQIAVDRKNKIIVAAGVSPNNSDQPFFGLALEQIRQRFNRNPKQAAADTGYCSEHNINLAKEAKVDFLCPPGALRKGAQRKSEVIREMEERLKDPPSRTAYNQRSETVEPVFGDFKANQGFTRYFVRGLAKVTGDWLQRACVHNLIKMFRAKTSL